MPLPLIDKKDNFELITNEIAAILAIETINQQALATAAGKDPKLWEFKVYVERSNPWELLPDDEEPIIPIVNVWWEGLNFDRSQSSPTLRQTSDPSVFNIDIIADSIAEKLPGTGQKVGDKAANENTKRMIRLVRNILFSVPPDSTQPGEDYAFLNMKGIVGERWIQNISRAVTDYDKQSIPVAAARIALAVKHLETGIEGPYQNLELLQAQTTFTGDGEVVYEFDLTG